MSYVGGRKGGGEMVLESRHLVGLFLLMVVVSGIVFTLGYILGRSQRHLQVRPAVSGTGQPSSSSGARTASAPADSSGNVRSDWAFYSPAEPKKVQDRPERPRDSSSAAEKPAPGQSTSKLSRSKGKPLLHAPLVPRGSIVLQVAAMTREGDALILAEALQKKKFPAFVLTPGADQYYRIQVGPYADARSAEMARRGLEQEGFKAMYKR